MTLIIALLGFGILLVLAEMVIPGGVVGVFGILMIATGIVLGFRRDTALGVELLAGSFVFAMFAFWAWVKFFPGSPFGKRMFLSQNAKEWRGYDKENATLLDKTGVSHTMLRPSGTVIIDGKRYDVVGEGPVIEKGRPVKVVRVEGNRIVVAEEEAEPALPPGASPKDTTSLSN